MAKSELAAEAVAVEVVRREIEFWAAKNATPDWLFACAKTLEGWPIGRELSETDYLAATQRAATLEVR